MKKVPKGELTRMKIVDDARGIFNEKGISLTLDNIASELGITKGKISNHFSTKDKLFLAILSDYEEKQAELIQSLREHYTAQSLNSLVKILSKVMDLQYEYRCCTVYLSMISSGQAELRNHIKVNINRNIGSIRVRIMQMVENKVLDERLLEKHNFEAFLFVYINQLTQWVIHFEMYDRENGYPAMKPVYIRGIINHLYQPYLTPKGKKEFASINFKNLK